MRDPTGADDRARGPRGTAAQLERPVPSSDEFWQTIYPAQQPVVFRGAADRWEILRAGAGPYALLDAMNDLAGDRQVVFGVGLPGDDGFMHYADLRDGFEPNVAQVRWRFARFVGELRREVESPSGHYVYAHSIPVAQDMPALLPMLDVPLLRGQELKGGHWRLWISSGRHLLNTHFDAFQNLVVVRQGTKRYTLFPPEQYANLYPGPFDQGPFSATVSMVHPRHPDLERYPRYAEALSAAVEVELAAGDVLFLPAHWWHTVETPGFTIAANYWWGHTERERRLAKSVLLHGLLHLRSLPEYQRRFWRMVMDHYVFQTAGPPHEAAGPERVDITGATTPARLERIRASLALTERESRVEPVDAAAVTAADRLRIAPAAALDLGGAEALNLVVGGQPVTSLSRSDLDVLLQFRAPARPEDVAIALAGQGYDVTPTQVMVVVRELCKVGCLVRAG
jgi:hypothetical protein